VFYNLVLSDFCLFSCAVYKFSYLLACLACARRHLVVVSRYSRSLLYCWPDVIWSLSHATVGLCTTTVPSVLLAWRLQLPHRQLVWHIIVHWQFSSPAENKFCFQIRPRVLSSLRDIFVNMLYIFTFLLTCLLPWVAAFTVSCTVHVYCIQINLYVHMEQKPHKKEELMIANSVLKLAENLIKVSATSSDSNRVLMKNLLSLFFFCDFLVKFVYNLFIYLCALSLSARASTRNTATSQCSSLNRLLTYLFTTKTVPETSRMRLVTICNKTFIHCS